MSPHQPPSPGTGCAFGNEPGPYNRLSSPWDYSSLSPLTGSPRKDTRPPWPGPTNPALGRSQTHLAPLDLPPELLDALRAIVPRALLGEQPDEGLLKTRGVSAALRRPPPAGPRCSALPHLLRIHPRGAAGSTDRSPGAAGSRALLCPARPALPTRSLLPGVPRPLPPFAFVFAPRPAPAPPSSAPTAARGRWKAGPAQPRPVPHPPHRAPPNSPPLSTHPPCRERTS